MQNPATTLYCPNPLCQAPNPLSHNFCQKCRTPLLKRYLRAVGCAIEEYGSGEILAERYLITGNRILLDTKPGLPPETKSEIPEALAPYLKLSPYKLHIPQVYGLSQVPEPHIQEIWLLEEVPIYSGGTGTSAEGQLMPELVLSWQTAPALRQLNWLWQMAQLWQPLSKQGVTSTLLTPGLLRVEGSLVRTLDLQLDENSTPTLKELGQLWLQWVNDAHPTVANFLKQLCQQLATNQVGTSEQLVELLDEGMAQCGRAQSTNYQIATRSDTGPKRRRNEDACYPPNGTAVAVTTGMGVAIVCDGIGGHEGGDIASNLAIDTIRQRIDNLSQTSNWNPNTLSSELEEAACQANDSISSRNDREQRYDRQRMGTTLVMALAEDHQIYLTHVGDSRAYRVTRTGCHQLTLDDDLASREVRLGYAIYRDAVQQPTSGSLVQALGMGSSKMLHPTVQRFIVDEDCVFLLCSDGLSDLDRVEQYWEREIIPILDKQVDLPTAASQLIQLGNSLNGHDNVTVALIYCQVGQSQETGQAELSSAQRAPVPPPTATKGERTIIQSASAPMRTQQLPSRHSPRLPWSLLLGSVLILGLSGTLAYWGFILGGFSFLSSLINGTSTTATSPTASPSDSPPSPGLESEALRELTQETTVIVPHQSPSKSPQVVEVTLPANSVLRLREKKPESSDWLVKVCLTPSINGNLSSQTKKTSNPHPKPTQAKPSKPSVAPSSSSTPATNLHPKVGEVVTIAETTLTNLSKQYTSSNPEVQQECPDIPATPSPTSK